MVMKRKRKAITVKRVIVTAVVTALITTVVTATVVMTNRTNNLSTISEGGGDMTIDVMNDPANQERIEELRALGMRDHEVRASLEVHGRYVSMDFIESQRQFILSVRQNNLRHILTGEGFPIAPNNIDMTTIKRFVFTFSTFIDGHSLVIDKTYGGVHFSDRSNSMYQFLDFAHFSATFTQQDLDRLIEAIEESELRHWQEHYEGVRDGGPGSGARFSWSIGIEFADGSLMRRSGVGDRYHTPPEHQWGIFTNFINTMGEEIIERHNAENPQADE